MQSQIDIRVTDNLEGTVHVNMVVEGTTRGAMLTSILDNLPEGADVQLRLNRQAADLEDGSLVEDGDSVSITPKKVDGGAA